MIPYRMNPMGISATAVGNDHFISFTVGNATINTVGLGYRSSQPITVLRNGEFYMQLPAHDSFAVESLPKLEWSDIGSVYQLNFGVDTVFSAPPGNASMFYQWNIEAIKIRGYSPNYLGDLFYNCGGLASIDIDEEELTRNCTAGWRVFADCSRLVFTPTARYWWENPNWIGDHRAVFRRCTSMPNYNQIPSSWGGGLTGA